ncbi:MAG: glycoside hydrolase family 18 protein [Balneolaceae bacterium]|nr:glycoside hydrolase family 18 protein [Balneolaceae bacterium]
MKTSFAGIALSLFASILLISCNIFENDSGMPSNEDIWVNAYLVSWQHNPETQLINSGILKTDEIDWDAMTHLTYFSLAIGEDGLPSLSLDPSFRNNLNTDRIQSIVTAAHANDTKILLSVGGGTNYEGFSGAIDSSRTQFVQTISNMITEFGFDGISLNMSPIETRDFINYRIFVRQLSAAFDNVETNQNKRPLLTAGATKSPGVSLLFEDLQQHFDQINILTYDMAQPWRGWIAWHNSALFNKEVTFEEEPTILLPSIDQKINEWVDAGVERRKLGIAINFYGSVWQEQRFLGKWPTWPTEETSFFSVQPYSVLNRRYNLDDYQWDEKAGVPYLNLSQPRVFVSFDNERSISEKMIYAKTNRLGGVMIWDISAGFSQNTTPKDPLLKAVKSHLNN